MLLDNLGFNRNTLLEELELLSEESLAEQLTEPIDVGRYLQDVPFYCPYNCEDYLLSASS
jgi:hypothetical protein